MTITVSIQPMFTADQFDLEFQSISIPILVYQQISVCCKGGIPGHLARNPAWQPIRIKSEFAGTARAAADYTKLIDHSPFDMIWVDDAGVERLATHCWLIDDDNEFEPFITYETAKILP